MTKSTVLYIKNIESKYILIAFHVNYNIVFSFLWNLLVRVYMWWKSGISANRSYVRHLQGVEMNDLTLGRSGHLLSERSKDVRIKIRGQKKQVCLKMRRDFRLILNTNNAIQFPCVIYCSMRLSIPSLGCLRHAMNYLASRGTQFKIRYSPATDPVLSLVVWDLIGKTFDRKNQYFSGYVIFRTLISEVLG